MSIILTLEEYGRRSMKLAQIVLTLITLCFVLPLFVIAFNATYRNPATVEQRFERPADPVVPRRENTTQEADVESTEWRKLPGDVMFKEGDPRCKVSYHLMRAIIITESGGNQKAVSKKGAIGLTQLMPATARELGVNPHDPAANVAGGCIYVTKQIERFGDEVLGIAAFNMGPNALARWLKRGGNIAHLPKETADYVKRVKLNAAVSEWKTAQR